MLKDLNYSSIYPSVIFATVAMVNEIDLSSEKNYFEHYSTGVYRHDGYIFNFDGFINEKCTENIIDKWVKYGVCDNYTQILEKYDSILNNPDKKYVIGLSSVERKKQPFYGGWRWEKWGEYIGTQNPQHEYLYNDIHIDKVYHFHIYEID